MSVHDGVVEYRTRLVAVIEASPNIRVACRAAGIHHSTFYRWRRDPSPHVYSGSWLDQWLGKRIVVAALADPSAGPQRLSDQLDDMGVAAGPSKVWRVLKRHRLNTRALRYRLLEQQHLPPSIVVASSPQAKMGHLDATVPGDLVQMDCLHIGSFKETKVGRAKRSKGQIWQYTAIDVASSYTWAEIAMTPHNPDPVITSELAHRVAADLETWGWHWDAVMTDNGNEYRAKLFRDTVEGLGVDHRFIRSGRPQSNGKVERVQGTMIQELYQPTLIGYVEPSITGIRRDLDAYLTYYNHKRRHRGRWNKGATPASIITPNPKTKP
jgi:transposase InsO family protein